MTTRLGARLLLNRDDAPKCATTNKPACSADFSLEESALKVCTTNVLARSAGFILQRLHEKATGARARDVEAHISAPHYGEEDGEDGYSQSTSL